MALAFCCKVYSTSYERNKRFKYIHAVVHVTELKWCLLIMLVCAKFHKDTKHKAATTLKSYKNFGLQTLDKYYIK